MTTPKRIQRKRTKGWRMPRGAIYVGRPSKFGNPFKGRLDRDASPDLLVLAFSNWVNGGTAYWEGAEATARRAELLKAIGELRGKDLACWCPLVDADGKPVPCHADILLRLANG